MSTSPVDHKGVCVTIIFWFLLHRVCLGMLHSEQAIRAVMRVKDSQEETHRFSLHTLNL